MSYNQNIPVATDYMVISRPQIKANFQVINQVFAKNHVALNATNPGNLQGMHSVLTFRANANPALDPATTANQIALYTKIISNNAVLFFRPSNSQTPIQLTYPSISTGLQSRNPDVWFDRQYSFLPGPFVFYLGILAVPDGTVITLTPSTTLIYVGLVLVGGLGSDKPSAAATNIAGNQFTVRFSAGSANPFFVYYIAIGV